MRILHFNEFVEPVGGVETYLSKLVELLNINGHESVTIFRKKLGNSPIADQSNIFHVPDDLEVEKSTDLIRYIIAAKKPDIALLHAVYDARLIAQVSNLLPTVGYIHTYYPICPGLGKFRKRDEFICNKPFGFSCISGIYLNRCASARNPLSVYRIFKDTSNFIKVYKSLKQIIVGSNYMRDLLVQNGFDSKLISVLPPHFEDSHLVKFSDEVPPRILFVGRIEIEKGLPYLLSALAKIKLPFKLHIIGDGTQRSVCETLVIKWGLSDKVEFAGWLEYDQLALEYQKAQLVVVPSIWPEPFGKVGIESMAYGRPVIAFDVGGISEWLINGWNGYLIPRKSTSELAARIEELISDRLLAERLGTNGREFVHCNFSPDNYINKFLDVLKF